MPLYSNEHISKPKSNMHFLQQRTNDFSSKTSQLNHLIFPFMVHSLRAKWLIIIIVYPLITRVVGAPQMILQPVFSIFPCSPLPSGTCRTPGMSIPWCCLPTSSFVRLVFFPLSLCQDGFGQTWWTGNMTIPLQFASFYDRQEIFMWFNRLLDLGTDFLVGNMVFVWDV